MGNGTQLILWKRCSDCRRELPISEFYDGNGTLDGKMAKCKDCHKTYTRLRRTEVKEAVSTTIVRNELERHRLSCTPGRAAGMPYVDLAWNGIAIEAKRSKEYRPHEFLWQFTRRQQRVGFSGFVIFVAQYPTGTMRFFVVPTSESRFFDKSGCPKRTALSVALNATRSDRPNNLWLLEYENAFHLLRETYQARTEDSDSYLIDLKDYVIVGDGYTALDTGSLLEIMTAKWGPK